MTKSLWDLMQGEAGQVSGFHDDLDDDYRIRLMELGFHHGEQVTCVQAPGLGAPRLYRVQNTIYSLDDRIASQVSIRTGTEHG